MSPDPVTPPDRSRPGLFLPVLLGLVASIPLAAGLWMSWRIREVSRWPQAPGRILSYGPGASTISALRDFDRGYQPHLECVFEAQGRRWGNRRPLLFPGWFSEKESKECAEEVGERVMLPGESPGSFSSCVMVHYNPVNPEDSVVAVNGRWPANAMIIVGASFVALALALFVHRRSRG